MRKFVYLFLFLIFLVACSKQPIETINEGQTIQPIEEQAETLSVVIKDFKFTPAEIQVTKGTTITWTQQDSAPHTVTGDEFDSGTLSQGQTYSRTFNEAGIYDYVCTIHPSMKGKVVVS